MTPQSPNINRWRAFSLPAVAYFMTIIDLTIVNVSLPTIGRELHFSETSLQWVVTAYALTFGGLCCSAVAPAVGVLDPARLDLTTRRFAGCARSDGGSVHGCKAVGSDTVGAGIEFAVSCQGGDFLTDSLGG